MRADRRRWSGPLRLLVLGVGGESTPFVADLLAGLAGSGCSVTLATARTGPGIPEVLARLRSPDGERRLFADPLGVAAALRAVAGAPRAAAALAARARRLHGTRRARWRAILRSTPSLCAPWDVIYLPWVGSLLSFAPLVGGPIPLVVSCRGAQINIARHDPVRRRRFAALVEALRQVARVHCVSADLARTVGDLGVDAARIRVIRPAVDTARFAPGADPDSHRPGGDRLRLVTVGRLHWKKGHEYALVALRRLLDRGVPAELTLIGDGPEHGRLAYTVRDLGLADRAILRGPLDRDGVRRQLLRSDLFLLTSLTEGLSNAALEAMACGLPVVSTAAGGMGEAITDGEEGLLVALRDPEAIAAACETLWRDPGRRLVMGASARRRVERDFDSRDQIEAFGSMLREVAASARPEGAG